MPQANYKNVIQNMLKSDRDRTSLIKFRFLPYTLLSKHYLQHSSTQAKETLSVFITLKNIYRDFFVIRTMRGRTPTPNSIDTTRKNTILTYTEIESKGYLGMTT